MNGLKHLRRSAFVLCTLFSMESLSFASQNIAPAHKEADKADNVKLEHSSLRKRGSSRQPKQVLSTKQNFSSSIAIALGRAYETRRKDIDAKSLMKWLRSIKSDPAESTKSGALLILDACKSWEDIGLVRRGLEAERKSKSVRAGEYRALSDILYSIEDATVIHLSSHAVIGEENFKDAIKSCQAESRKISKATGDVEFYFEWFDVLVMRFELERDRAYKSVTEDQYITLKAGLLEKEKNLFAKHPLPPQQMQAYYAFVAELPGCFVTLEKTILSQKAKSEPPTQVKRDDRPLDVKVASIIGLLLALVGAATGFFFAWSKYQVESKERKLKELQIEELSRKLDEQSAPKLIAA